MSIQPPHNKILVAAGRAILKPLGFRQKGASRTFFSDEGIWSCIVEFQPSSFARGSFLNVGAHWFWNYKDNISFDFGAGVDSSHRVHGFEEAVSEEAFKNSASHLATEAANHALNLRSRLSDVATIARLLFDELLAAGRGSDCWRAYNAAIACGLSARCEDAQVLFGRVIAGPIHHEWMAARHADAIRLRSEVGNHGKFSETIRARVETSRARMKLPPLPSTRVESPGSPATLNHNLSPYDSKIPLRNP